MKRIRQKRTENHQTPALLTKFHNGRFEMGFFMLHRHLNHEQFTLAAIDDVIGRGKRKDWAELRQAALADRVIMEKVWRICLVQGQDPYAQRYRFWRRYAEQHL